MTELHHGPFVAYLPVNETAGVTEGEELPARGHPAPRAGEPTPQLDQNLQGLSVEPQAADHADYRTIALSAGQAAQLARQNRRRQTLLVTSGSAGVVWLGRGGEVQAQLGYGLAAAASVTLANKGEVWAFSAVDTTVSTIEEYD